MRTKKQSWKSEKVMSRLEFNRDYMVRVRVKASQPCMREYNTLVGYDRLARILGCDEFVGYDLFFRVLQRARFAAADKFVCRPLHGVEVTFIAH